MEAPGRDSEGTEPGLTAGGRRCSGCPLSIAESFIHAWEGLHYVYETQRNMRVHVLAGVLAGGACIVLGMGRMEVLLVVLAAAGVLLAEVVNTVAEALADLMEPRQNPIAKVVKDVAAAGVLLGALFSVIIAVLVFCPAMSTLPRRIHEFLGERLIFFGVYSAVAIVPAMVGLALPVKASTRAKPGGIGEANQCSTRRKG